MESISIKKAIIIGMPIVNVPTVLIIFGPMLSVNFLIEHGIISHQYGWVSAVLFLIGFIVAWAWWSFSVPHWRYWAYQRVSDITLLKSRAVAAGLIWREGTFFSSTEFKLQKLIDLENEICK